MVERLSFVEIARQGRPLAGEMVIDAHTHLGLLTHYHVPRAGVDDLVAYMGRYGIARACTFAFAGVNSDFCYGNDLVAEAVRQYPAHFVGFATLNANYPEEMVPELERTARLGLRGIKLISAYQGHPEETERFFPVYEWAQARRRIILSHSWGAAAFLARVATAYPDVTFLIGHLNLGYAEVVRRHDNVYTTTTFVPWPGAIVQAVQAFGSEKMLFGSDFPDLDASLNIGPLLTARISDADKRAILGLNMQRILANAGIGT